MSSPGPCAAASTPRSAGGVGERRRVYPVCEPEEEWLLEAAYVALLFEVLPLTHPSKICPSLSDHAQFIALCFLMSFFHAQIFSGSVHRSKRAFKLENLGPLAALSGVK